MFIYTYAAISVAEEATGPPTSVVYVLHIDLPAREIFYSFVISTVLAPLSVIPFNAHPVT